MECAKFNELSMKFFDKSISKEELLQFEQHKVNCKSCNESFEVLCSAISELENNEEIEIEPNFTKDVMKKISIIEKEQESRESYMELAFYAVSLLLFLGTVSLWNYVFKNVGVVTIVREIKILIKTIIALIETVDILSILKYLTIQINSFLPIIFIVLGIYVIFDFKKKKAV